jgi:nitroreductase
METILTRRSIRQYTAESVPDEVVTDLLRAAMSAPSAGNEQPWQFVVVTDRALLDRVPEIHSYSQMLKQAPLGVLVCGDESKLKYAGYWVQDCSAATQNLLLAAHAKGLGAVWLGIYPKQDRVAAFRELFNLPQEITPLAMVAVGHPAEEKPPADRYDPARVHHNRWGEK